MHPLQNHILKKLTLNDYLRYADLKPKGVESNRFVYHLQRLIEDGLIEKSSNSYKLTAKGKRYVSKLSLQMFQVRMQPKIVTLIICENKKGEHLLCKWRRQPFYGLVSFPFGKVHFGETITEAAHRELKEKTGLKANLTHRGDVYMTIREKGEIVSHMFCHVFYGKNPSGTLLHESSIASCGWENIKKVDQKSFIPGFLKVYDLALKSKKRFFEEIIA